MRHCIAFTLIELLDVIAILGVLLALLVPGVQKVRESANRLACGNNLRQVGLSLHSYHDIRKAFPPGAFSRLANPNWVMPPGNCTAFPDDICPGWGLLVLVLLYVEQDAVRDAINFNLSVSNPANGVARRMTISTYVCPSDSGSRVVQASTCGSPPQPGNTPQPLIDGGLTSCVGSLGGSDPINADSNFGCYEYQPFNGMFHRNSKIKPGEVRDGLSNTIGLGERSSRFVEALWAGLVPGGTMVYNQTLNQSCQNWRPPIKAVVGHARLSPPNDPEGSSGTFHSEHPGGVNFMLMD